MWIPDGIGGAREVPEDEGLLVWTLGCEDFPGAACNGWAWYAVTAVDPHGNENPVVTAENRVRVYEGFGEPLPIEVPRQYMDCSIPGYCPHDNASDPNPIPPGLHVFIQYMDLGDWNDTFTAPNFTNCWYGEGPGEIHIQNNRQYAFSYVVSEPDPSLPSIPGELTPVVIDLHHHSNNAVGPRWGINGVDAYAVGGGAIKIMPTDVGDTWWFGFNSEFDYRSVSPGHCYDGSCSQAQAPFPPVAPFTQMPTEGEIVNYTEARVLRMVYDLFRMPLGSYPADPDRIYIQGQSMGATGAMQLSTRYPDIFAAAACAKPMTDFEQYLVGNPAPKATHDARFEVPVLWGPYPSLASANGLQLLGIRTTGPGEWANHLALWDGSVIWDWMDLIEQMQSPERVGDDSAPLGIVSGFGDMVVPYPTQGLPFYDQTGGWGDLGRAWGGKITCNGHNGPIHEGMPPALTNSVTNPIPAPFSDYNIRRKETIPGFMNLSGGHYPAPPVTCCKAPCVPQGPHYYYQDLIWSSTWYDWDTVIGPPVELPNRWAISVKWTGSFAPAPTVDIVPRRLQVFKVVPDVPYQWINVELGTGVTVQAASAPIEPTPAGLLVLEDVRLTPPGNRIILFRQP
jgi:pimeloyl-ACP methyl ester carboxylesterase